MKYNNQSEELTEGSNIVKSSWSDKISTGINTGSHWISWGLLKGAEYASVLVEKV